MVMKYIENVELREWVKDSLKKTIFQKAHALAVQTGCQILVKLEDDYDPTRHQYYATDKLRKVFKNNGLRQQSGEKFVSGVTGEPLIDQAIQSDVTSHVDAITNNVVDQGQGSTSSDIEVRSQGSGPEERLMDPDLATDNEAISGEEEAVPMQLSMTAESIPSETADDVNLKSEGTEESIPIPTGIQIKMERLDDDPGGGTGDMEDTGANSTSMFGGFDPNTTTGQSDSSSSSQFQSVPTPVTPLVQYQSSYQVPMSPKPYQCAMCGKAFRSVQVLQKHTQTFHMKTQHAMMGVRRGRGRPQMKLNRPHPQPSSFTCVMCHITFPEAEILQEHMTRTHMGGGTPQPQETMDDFSTPGTSQQSAVPSFSIPHTQSSPGDASPIASQASLYSSQGTPSSAPVFPRNVSAAESKPGPSTGTSRDAATKLPPSFSNTDFVRTEGFSFRVLTRTEPLHIFKQIELGIKNKWSWGWLSKMDINGDCLSQYVKKINQPGLAWCTWCKKVIRYGTSGKKAIEKHAQNAMHKKNKLEHQGQGAMNKDEFNEIRFSF